MSSFTTVRTVWLSFFFLLNVLLLGFASAALNDCLRAAGDAPPSLVLTIVGSVLVLVFVPTALRGLYYSNFFLSHAWFESSWLGLFSVLQFGTTLSVTTSQWAAFCNIQKAEKTNDAVAYTVPSPPCQHYQALLCLSWMAAIAINLWFLCSTAIVLAHACNDADVWFLDMHDMRFGTATSIPTFESEKPTLKYKVNIKPVPPIRVDADNIWSAVELEGGMGVDTNPTKSRFTIATFVSHASRRGTFWSIPQWARNAGKRGVTPAFPAAPTRPKMPPIPVTPLHDFIAAYRQRSLPPTPVVSRPTNPEPTVPSVARIPPPMPLPTVSRLIRDVEREVMESHRAAAHACLEGLSWRSSNASWDLDRVFQPQITPKPEPVSRWSHATEDMTVRRHGMSWLNHPYSPEKDTQFVQEHSTYDAPSFYSLPSATASKAHAY